jgi:hypothetical protein
MLRIKWGTEQRRITDRLRRAVKSLSQRYAPLRGEPRSHVGQCLYSGPPKRRIQPKRYT